MTPQYTKQEIATLFSVIKKHYNYMYSHVKLELLNSFIKILKENNRSVTIGDLEKFKLELEKIVLEQDSPPDVTMEQLLADFLNNPKHN